MFTTPYSYPSTSDYWGQTKPYYDYWGETTTYYDYTTTPTTTLATTTQRAGTKMPKSCCIRDTNYDSIYFMCDEYFTRGCHGPLTSILSESVMMIGSSALIIGVVQVNL